MYKKLSYIIATFFGAGRSPFAPGTCGSLATLPVVYLVCHYFGLAGLLAFIAAVLVLGTLATREVLKYTKHDPSFIVIDETAGQSLAFVSVIPYLDNWLVYAAGFVLFRFFDIVKIGPVKWADRKVANEYGVMLDDVFAGLISAVILYGLVFGLYQR